MIAGYPKWVDHQEMPIWSIDAQPNGYRLLTGGGDNRIKIWNILPIISPKHEIGQNFDGNIEDDDDDIIPKAEQLSEQEHITYLESLFENEANKYDKLLAILNVHTSPVNCVRWNRLGTLFASASDDGTIYIWEYRGTKRGSFQDSNKTFEDWMAVKSLRGHKDNIFDVKWAPDSTHLASCGVDGDIYIWNVFNANPIHILKGHESYVNGVVFDPIGRYMASQSNQDK